jgi:hypothetical protein
MCMYVCVCVCVCARMYIIRTCILRVRSAGEEGCTRIIYIYVYMHTRRRLSLGGGKKTVRPVSIYTRTRNATRTRDIVKK